MNDVKLAEMMKNMPEDMIAESAEFAADKAGNTLTMKAAGEARANVSTVKRSSGFRVHPALIAASVILIVAALTGITVGVVKNLGGRKQPLQPGGVDEHDPNGIATPVPNEFRNVELIDVSSLIDEDMLGTGQLRIPEEDEELQNSSELFSAMLSAQEARNTGPIIWDGEPLLCNSLLNMIGDAEQEAILSSNICEITPRELEGHARLFKSRVRMDFEMILIDGTIFYTLDRPDLAVDSAVMYDYDGNGVEDILLIFTEKENVQFYDDPDPAVSRYWKGFYVLDLTKREFVKICEYYAPLNDMPMILSSGDEANIWLNSSKMGGKISMEDGKFTVGGADPDEFFAALYNTSTIAMPSNEIKLVFNLKERTGKTDPKNDYPTYTLVNVPEPVEITGNLNWGIIQKEYDRLPVFNISDFSEMIFDFYWTNMPREIEIDLVYFDKMMDLYNEGRSSMIYPSYNNKVTISADKTVVVLLATTYYHRSTGIGYHNIYAFILAAENDLPLPTVQPTITPMPGQATPIPWDDPQSIYYIADNFTFLKIRQDAPKTVLEEAKIYHFFDGIRMVGAGSEEYHTIYMKAMTEHYKNKDVAIPEISVSREFTLEPIDGGEILYVDVYAVNDAEDTHNITADLIAEDLSKDAFMEFAESMDFRPGLNGEPLPCFAVFYVKKAGAFIEVTGEYEYVIKQCIFLFTP